MRREGLKKKKESLKKEGLRTGWMPALAVCGILAAVIEIMGEVTGTATVCAEGILISDVTGSDTQSQITVTGYAAYDEILRKYYTAYQAGWDVADFEENGLCYVAGFLSSPDELGYYLMDLDTNGTEELLIGEVSEAAFSYPGLFYDCYTIEDGKLTKVAESAQRSCYYLCAEGLIAYEGSSSAFCYSKAYYALDGSKLDVLEAVLFDDAYDSENPYFYSTESAWDDYSTPITDKEAANVYASYEYMKIAYTPLSEVEETLKQVSLASASEKKQQAIEEVEAAYEAAMEIENTLSTDSTLSQGEMNELSFELYETWDDVLNVLWGYLKETLTAVEMADLTTEELVWIEEKETAVAEAGAEVAGGSLQALVENTEAASMTRKRVYVLLERLS